MAFRFKSPVPIVASLGAGAIAFAAYAYSPGYLTGPAIADRVEGLPLNGVVRVEFDNRPGGSGFAIEGNRIITNHHVIQRALRNDDITTRVRAWIVEGETVYPVIYTATIAAYDERVDLAVLDIDAEWSGATLEFADAPPRARDAVCKAGSALGRLPQITCGLWGAVDERELRGVRHASHSAPSAPGDSGGPVLDEHNRVVGVTRAVPVAGMGSLVTTMGLAIPLDVVREFLDSLEDE